MAGGSYVSDDYGRSWNSSFGHKKNLTWLGIASDVDLNNIYVTASMTGELKLYLRYVLRVRYGNSYLV